MNFHIDFDSDQISVFMDDVPIAQFGVEGNVIERKKIKKDYEDYEDQLFNAVKNLYPIAEGQ